MKLHNGTVAVAALLVITGSTGLSSLYFTSGATDVGLGGITFRAEN